MDERERILELVREGVLSVDEGLDLLESVATKESKQTEQREFTNEKTKDTEVEIDMEDLKTEADTEEDYEEEFAHEEQEETEDLDEEMNQFEEELESLANDLNQFSVDIDELNEEITELKTELADVEEEIYEETDAADEEYYEEKKELEDEIVNLQKEIDLIATVDEVDNKDEMDSLNKELTETMEELNNLENKAASDEDISELTDEAEELREKIKKLTEKKNERLKEMHSVRMKQWTTKAKRMSESFDIPKEWRKGASKTIDKAGDIFDETSKTLGGALRQTLQNTKDTLENIDWKDLDLNFNLGRKVQSEFDHEWLFEDTTATILDFKNANGNIQFKPSLNDNIKVSANIKLYGKMDEASPMDALEARSTIYIDEDKFTFHIPNKNIVANMIVYLPEREYDYVRSNSFNGDVTFNELKTRDIYIKTTNGHILLDKLEATMLEVKGTNGNITLKEAKLRDLLVNTVNGEIRVVGEVQSSDVNTTNGDIRMTLSGEELIRIAGGSVNGDVKISFPEDCGLEIEAKSTFGSVKSRLANTNASVSKELKGKTHTLQRIGSGEICRVNVTTTTGNILFKDTEEK